MVNPFIQSILRMFKLNEFIPEASSFEKLIQKYGGHCLNRTIIQLGFGSVIDGVEGRRIRVKIFSNSLQYVKKHCCLFRNSWTVNSNVNS